MLSFHLLFADYVVQALQRDFHESMHITAKTKSEFL